MRSLKISNDVSLPIDAATQTFAFIGRKGSGKSYGSSKLVELLIGAGIQVAILDPVGNWYGLRLSADGKKDGFDIPIVGGLRGDIPLESTGGALIADVLIDSGRSMIIDVSQFTKADRQRFAHALGEQLWKRKKGERSPRPIHLVLEESQLIVPERVGSDTARLVGIYEEIIRLGRNYGIGVTMITQRPQSVNKEVLNQTECLMAFQVNGAHERNALRAWIVHQGMDVNMVNELPSLKPGNCYVWSPQWLDLLKKIKILPRETFDSTSTPKVGGTFRGKKLQAIDLEMLKEKMKETIERQKADDPRELKKQITELKQQLSKQTPKAESKVKEVNVLKPSLITRIEKLYASIIKEAERHGKAMNLFWGNMDELNQSMLLALKSVSEDKSLAINYVKATMESALLKVPHCESIKPAKYSEIKISNGEKLAIGEKTILIAIAQFGKVERDQLSVLSGYKRSSRDAYIVRLKAKGYLESNGNITSITQAGINALGNDYEPLPIGAALREYWMNKLPEGEAKILEILCHYYPKPVNRQVLDGQTSYKRSSRDAYLVRLQAKRLITIEGPGMVRASENLF